MSDNASPDPRTALRDGGPPDPPTVLLDGGPPDPPTALLDGGPPDPRGVSAPRARRWLDALDDRVVPHLQRAARGLAAGLGRPLRWLAAVDRRLLGADRAAGWRPLVALVAAALLFGGAWIHLDRFTPRHATATQELRGGGTPAGEVLAGGAQVVGPLRGAAIAPYIRARVAELTVAPADERRVAVVSLTDYVTPEQVLTLLDGLPVVVHRVQMRLPAEGFTPFETDVVGGDLIGSVQRALAEPLEELAAEEEAVRAYLESGTVEDPAFRHDYELRAEELAAVRSLVNSGAGVVFALVVEGPVGVLRDLQDDPQVRLVDLAPPETDVANSTFYGLLPEDQDVTSYGG